MLVQEVAEAFAAALAEVLVACDVVGKGDLCALGISDINTTVYATAEAFAFAFIEASSTCEAKLCTVDVAVLTEAFAEVVSSAVAWAIEGGCIGTAPSRPCAALPHTQAMHTIVSYWTEPSC